MPTKRPARWRRKAEGRRLVVRRLLAYGALAGFAVGVAAVLLVPVSGDAATQSLVRLAFFTPFAIFMGWWLLGPGFMLDRGDEAPARPAHQSDHEALMDRMRRLESTFDHAARPAADGHPHVDADHDGYRTTLRPTHAMDRATIEDLFGVHNPMGPSAGEAAAEQRAAE